MDYDPIIDMLNEERQEQIRRDVGHCRPTPQTQPDGKNPLPFDFDKQRVVAVVIILGVMIALALILPQTSSAQHAGNTGVWLRLVAW